MGEKTYTVKQVSEMSGASIRALRHYEELGLLVPQRRPNGYRAYGHDDIARLQQILCDYASLEEMFGFEEMENYEPDEICRAVDELTGKEEYNNLLLEISKPYGKVYAVNKRRIPEMMFTYQPLGFNEMIGQ